MNTLFLTLVEQIVKALELRLIDYEHGGFLPAERRGLTVYSQARLGGLVSKLARVKVLNKHEVLRDKLLILACVLKNEYPKLPKVYFSETYTPKKG